MLNPPIQVYIVDGDPSIRTTYERTMRSAKMHPRTFGSVEDFIRSDFNDENACVVADVQFAGRSGLQLPVLLARDGHLLPMLFVTVHDTSKTRDLAFRRGAAGCFRKPVNEQELLDAIIQAVIDQSGNIP